MEVIEVQIVGLEPLEGFFTLLPDLAGGGPVGDARVCKSHLAGQDDLIPASPLLEPRSDDLFTSPRAARAVDLAPSVDVGRVQQVAAPLQIGIQLCKGLFLFQLGAKHHAAVSQLGDLDPAVSQLYSLHGTLLLRSVCCLQNRTDGSRSVYSCAPRPRHSHTGDSSAAGQRSPRKYRAARHSW